MNKEIKLILENQRMIIESMGYLLSGLITKNNRKIIDEIIEDIKKQHKRVCESLQRVERERT